MAHRSAERFVYSHNLRAARTADRLPSELLMRLAAGLREGGVGAGALVQQGEAERLHQAGVLTTTFQTAEEQLNQFVQDPRASIDKRVAMADIRGRFGYMKRALPNFIEVGRRMSEALSAGRVEEA